MLGRTMFFSTPARALFPQIVGWSGLLLSCTTFPLGCFASPASPTSCVLAYSTSTATEGNDGLILQPQGKHHSWYSLKPVIEGAKWAKSPGPYFKEKIAASGGAPIFKMHPGLASIALTDHASAKWFFSQPDTVLDRQDGAYFGAFKCSENYLGKSLPALIANLKESHPLIREYMLTIAQERISSCQAALSHATDNFYKDLRINGLGRYSRVYDTFLQHTYAFMLEFIFGLGEEDGHPLPPFKDFRTVNPHDFAVLIKLDIDRPIANAVAQLAQSGLGGGITKNQKASVDVVLDSIRSSKMWPRFTEVLEEMKVPMKDLERAWMFTASFQTSVVAAKQMENVIGALTANRDFLKELQHEVDGKDLTLKSVCDETQFPLLDSFHWEIARMFPAPPFYVKEAKMDLLVPSSSGERYQIRKGDMLFCHQDLAQIDTAAFGADAREFKPKRFVGNPDLKKKVFKFGYHDAENPVQKDGMPWGCVAHALGLLDGILKVFYARWVQEMDWELTTPPIIDPEKFLGISGPMDMEFKHIAPRN